MKKAVLVSLVVLALSACSRTGRPAAGAAADRPIPAPAGAPAPAAPAFLATPGSRPEDRIIYYPSMDRVLYPGDASGDDMQWKPLGIVLPEGLGQVRHALVLTDTALLDKDGNPNGVVIPEGAQLSVQEVGEWIASGSGFTRLYRIQGRIHGGKDAVQGWIDSANAPLILAEEPGLQVGIIPRKIVIGSGESEYSLLVVVDGTHVTILDTSYFPFPDGFHPSGVVSVSLQDVNADSRAEIVLEAETLISLRYLGATPIRWKAWLRRGYIGALVPIFRYNESFGSDAGYSYTATERRFDSDGKGSAGTVRVDTEYMLVSGADEFQNHTVTFYPWDGSEFRHDTLQDLPALGTVAADQAALYEQADTQSDTVAPLSRGDQLYVFDRGDTRQSPADARSWWYRAVTKSGIEGWIMGTLVDLSWIDPLKTNRTVFLAQN